MKEFVTSATITDGVIGFHNRRMLETWARTQRDGEYTLTIERAHATRSLDQNALYWVGYVQPIANHTGYDALSIHAYLKKRFLPNQHLMIQNAAGEIVDETDIEPTTRKLNKVEFGEYLSAIEVWAAQELSVVCGSSLEELAHD